MEVAVIIGMILAFLLGAYVREPFLFAKKEEEKEEKFLPATEEADGERKKTKEERRESGFRHIRRRVYGNPARAT